MSEVPLQFVEETGARDLQIGWRRVRRSTGDPGRKHQAPPPSEVDEYVPHTQHVNLSKVRERQVATLKSVGEGFDARPVSQAASRCRVEDERVSD